MILHYKPFKKLYVALSLLILILISGSLGYTIIDDQYTVFDAFYMTIITVSTVGFHEVHPLTDAGKVFTAFLIITSFGTFAYAVSAISSYVIDGEYRKHLNRLKVDKELNKLKNHVIICGFGRNGSQAARVLKAHDKNFVIIDMDHERVEDIKEEFGGVGKSIVIEGDATTDEILMKARVKSAYALIAALPSDSANLFITLSARELNPNLKIISRASDVNSDKKLKRAGADNVIMPDMVGGAHMASLIMKPDIVEFLDYVSAESQVDFNLEEITFEGMRRELYDKTINELEIRRKTGANIIGLKTEEGEFVINPSPSTKINQDSKLFVIGNSSQIAKLKELFAENIVSN